MPKVDTTLAQLTSALGANREFWKIPLTKKSSYFNTMWPILLQQYAIWHFKCTRSQMKMLYVAFEVYYAM